MYGYSNEEAPHPTHTHTHIHLHTCQAVVEDSRIQFLHSIEHTM